jgi:hypothetical protein
MPNKNMLPFRCIIRKEKANYQWSVQYMYMRAPSRPFLAMLPSYHAIIIWTLPLPETSEKGGKST